MLKAATEIDEVLHVPTVRMALKKLLPKRREAVFLSTGTMEKVHVMATCLAEEQSYHLCAMVVNKHDL